MCVRQMRPPGRGDCWILKIAHAPSPKNLSKNGFCPRKGVAFLWKAFLQKNFQVREKIALSALTFGCSHSSRISGLPVLGRHLVSVPKRFGDKGVSQGAPHAARPPVGVPSTRRKGARRYRLRLQTSTNGRLRTAEAPSPHHEKPCLWLLDERFWYC